MVIPTGAQARAAVDNFCKRFKIDVIVRGHQVCLDGYWTFAGNIVITLFLAPAYTNQFKNAGGVLSVNEKLDCQLVAYVPDCGPKGAKDRVERTNRLWDTNVERIDEPPNINPPQIIR